MPVFGKNGGWKWKTKVLRDFVKKLYKYRVFLLMLAPAVLYTLIFAYYPMTGIVMAFKKYNYAGGIWGSPWNGIDNFKFFFKSGQAWTVTRNTVLYNLLFIAVNTIMQIAVAVFLTEIKNKHYRKTTQSLMFLPYFISWVIVGVMSFNILSSDYGFMNRLIEHFGGTRISFYTTPKVWPWILAFFNVWKGIGYGSVMYLAAIMELIHPYMKRLRLMVPMYFSVFSKWQFLWLCRRRLYYCCCRWAEFLKETLICSTI